MARKTEKGGFQSHKRIVRQNAVVGNQILGLHFLHGQIRIRLVQKPGLNAVFTY